MSGCNTVSSSTGVSAPGEKEINHNKDHNKEHSKDHNSNKPKLPITAKEEDDKHKVEKKKKDVIPKKKKKKETGPMHFTANSEPRALDVLGDLDPSIFNEVCI